MIMRKNITTVFLALFVSVSIGIVSTGCGDANSVNDGAGDKASESSTAKRATSLSSEAMMMAPGANEPHFIIADSANVMISSYLNSISYQQNDSDLRSIIIDADSLRAYLSDAGITKIKIMFAHRLDYIHNGGKDQPAGYKNNALTFVIAGFDKNDDYQFFVPTSGGSGLVLNHGVPCPTSCPPSGTASQDILPVPQP